MLPGTLSAQTDYTSANALLPGCRDFLEIFNGTAGATSRDQFRAGVCAGVVSAMLSIAPALDRQYRFCKPNEVTFGQAIQIVVKRLDALPETWHENFETLVLAVFAKNWPCN